MLTEKNRETSHLSVLENVKIGDRIKCGDHFGTVKYIGKVKGHPHEWLGIDWDVEERGKHNGTVDGIEYYKTRYPTSGSFVRPERVQFGKSIITSILERYGHEDDEHSAIENELRIKSLTKAINAPFLEMVGFDKVSDKQRQFNALKVINVREQNVNSAGSDNELLSLCPNIQELDLSKNLFSSWTSVFKICKQLENLELLIVSENFMEIPDDVREFNFPTIKALIATAMHLSWEQVLNLSTIFPNIIELRVPINDITSLTFSSNGLQKLTYLDLSDNKIEDWNEICKLSVLDNLEELLICNIGLKCVGFQQSEKVVNLFENLKKLNISYNLIDNWASFNQLNRLKRLEDIRCVRNPLFEDNNDFALVIARIENLKVYNGAPVKPGDRRGSEYDYIKKYALEWLSKETDEEKNAFLEEHNRFLDLITQHGCPEESELCLSKKNIQTSLVSLELIYEGRIVKKKIPNTLAVQKLGTVVQKVFKLKEKPNLLYVSARENHLEIPLEDAYKEIGFYYVEDGDKIIATV